MLEAAYEVLRLRSYIELGVRDAHIAEFSPFLMIARNWNPVLIGNFMRQLCAYVDRARSV